MTLLLISNSTLHGGGYLDHVENEIRALMGGFKSVVFIPFALHDCDAYAAKAQSRFGAMGYEVHSLHAAADPAAALRGAEVIFVGGGNTFRLLKTLQDLELLEVIRERVRAGMLYIGSSAGSNIAAPTIGTTNDMPIVQPRSFASLNLVPFQINPHYLDAEPASTHMGETREERILQFLEENQTPVVGLREGAWLVVRDGSVVVRGSTGARIFQPGSTPSEMRAGDEISALVGAPLS